MLDFDAGLLEHFKRVFLVVVMLFADYPFYSAVDYEHRASAARSHLAVHGSAVNRNSALGRLANGVLLGVNSAHAVVGDRAVGMNALSKKVAHVVAVRKARGASDIAGYQDLVVARDDAAASATVASGALGDCPGHFHKVFVPRGALVFFFAHKRRIPQIRAYDKYSRYKNNKILIFSA